MPDNLVKKNRSLFHWRLGGKTIPNDLTATQLKNLLSMEEIPNNHLGCIRPCREWDFNYQPQLVNAEFQPSTVDFPTMAFYRKIKRPIGATLRAQKSHIIWGPPGRLSSCWRLRYIHILSIPRMGGHFYITSYLNGKIKIKNHTVSTSTSLSHWNLSLNRQDTPISSVDAPRSVVSLRPLVFFVQISHQLITSTKWEGSTENVRKTVSPHLKGG